MFTVIGRVINELAEFTCAINFSLLFRLEARAQKGKAAELSWRMERREGRKGGKREHLNNNIDSNLPPNDYHNSTTFLLMFKTVYTHTPPPPSHPAFFNTGEVMKYGNGFGPPD